METLRRYDTPRRFLYSSPPGTVQDALQRLQDLSRWKIQCVGDVGTRHIRALSHPMPQTFFEILESIRQSGGLKYSPVIPVRSRGDKDSDIEKIMNVALDKADADSASMQIRALGPFLLVIGKEDSRRSVATAFQRLHRSEKELAGLAHVTKYSGFLFLEPELPLAGLVISEVSFWMGHREIKKARYPWLRPLSQVDGIMASHYEVKFSYQDEYSQPDGLKIKLKLDLEIPIDLQSQEYRLANYSGKAIELKAGSITPEEPPSSDRSYFVQLKIRGEAINLLDINRYKMNESVNIRNATGGWESSGNEQAFQPSRMPMHHPGLFFLNSPFIKSFHLLIVSFVRALRCFRTEILRYFLIFRASTSGKIHRSSK